MRRRSLVLVFLVHSLSRNIDSQLSSNCTLDQTLLLVHRGALRHLAIIQISEPSEIIFNKRKNQILYSNIQTFKYILSFLSKHSKPLYYFMFLFEMCSSNLVNFRKTSIFYFDILSLRCLPPVFVCAAP